MSLCQRPRLHCFGQGSLAMHRRFGSRARLPLSTILPRASSLFALSAAVLLMCVSGRPTPLVEPLEVSSDTSGPAEGGDPVAEATEATTRPTRLDTPPGFPPRPSSPPPQPVAVDSGAAGAGDTGSEDSGGAGPGGVDSRDAEFGGVGSGSADSRGATSPSGGGVVGALAGGSGVGQQWQSRRQETLSPQQLCKWVVWRGRSGAGAWGIGAGGAGAAGARGFGAGGTRAGGAGGAGAGGIGRTGAGGAGGARAGSTGGTGARGIGGATARGTGATGAGGAGVGGDGGIGAGGTGGTRARGTGAAGAGGAGPGGAGATGGIGTGGAAARGTGAGGAGTVGTASRRPFFFPQPQSSLPRCPTVSRFLATPVTDPSFESTAASDLATELVDFAATCRLDYVTSLVIESGSDCPPSVGSDVLEDSQFEPECLVAAVPHLASMLLCPEGDPDALDILTPRTHVEAITYEYSSQW
ncbi:unnamed protein product [Closterium sp. NIES-54]